MPSDLAFSYACIILFRFISLGSTIFFHLSKHLHKFQEILLNTASLTLALKKTRNFHWHPLADLSCAPNEIPVKSTSYLHEKLTKAIHIFHNTKGTLSQPQQKSVIPIWNNTFIPIFQSTFNSELLFLHHIRPKLFYHLKNPAQSENSKKQLLHRRFQPCPQLPLLFLLLLKDRLK